MDSFSKTAASELLLSTSFCCCPLVAAKRIILRKEEPPGPDLGGKSSIPTSRGEDRFRIKLSFFECLRYLDIAGRASLGEIFLECVE